MTKRVPKFALKRKISVDLLVTELVAIYCIVDPRDQMIRYVGQSTFPELRVSQHFSKARDMLAERELIYPGARRFNVAAWIAIQMAEGVCPEAYVLEVVQGRAAAAEREMYWIALAYSKGHPILNFRGGWDARWLHSKIRKWRNLTA